LISSTEGSRALFEGLGRAPHRSGPTAMHKRLRENGMLASTEEARGTLTVRRTLEGKRRNVLHLHASLLETEPAQSAQQTLLSADTAQKGQIRGADSSIADDESSQNTCPPLGDTGADGRIGQIEKTDDDIPF
jgi:hypothetical protein